MTTDNTTLSIRLVPGGFSFSGQTYNVPPGADYDQRLIEAMLDAEITKTETNSPVVCLVDTSRMCLAPSHLGEKMVEDLFHLTHTSSDREEQLIHQTDEVDGITFTFGISSQVYHFLLRTFQEVEFCHPLCLKHQEWRERLQQESPDGNCMVAFADDRRLSFLIYKMGRLQVANTIESASEGNLLYFLLNAWKQNGLDVLADTLYLESDSEQFKKTVSTYIKKCE